MRVSRRFLLPSIALSVGLLLAPMAALGQAHVANCPKEPQTGVPIASGDTFSGANCVLNTPGDIDGFTFGATAGDTYQLALGYQGGFTNVCLTLLDPTSAIIIPQTCTSGDAIVLQQKLTTTGSYNIQVTEPTGGAQSVDAYALSLERINPFPPDAQTIALATEVSGSLVPTEQNAFTFSGVTTGTYQVTLTYTGGFINACVSLYSPGTTIASTLSGCTSGGSFEFQFTPTQNATYMLLINGIGNNSTVSYNLEVSCAAGMCKQQLPPPCTLKDAASYANGTLTMNFTVGNNVATTWNIWLSSQNTITTVYSAAQPKTVPPVPITKTASLSPAGIVGILSTLTTSTKGIFCSSYVQVNTGTP
jgi:hypothetical protein